MVNNRNSRKKVLTVKKFHTFHTFSSFYFLDFEQINICEEFI